jgi:dTDP-4-dehydrorhamnose 3,5-epimerase
MRAIEMELPGVLLIEPDVFPDSRGFFQELWRRERYADWGIQGAFEQDNLSHSHRGVLRGLHFQEPGGQGKLVQVLSGAVFDVVVDIRRGSPHFGRWLGRTLSAENHLQIWAPPGYAHGFCVLSDGADFLYKCTGAYRPEHGHAIRFDDPDIGIDWPLSEPILSAKDRAAPRLRDAAVLPEFEP